MNPSGRSTYHPSRDATSCSTSASTSRKVVWKGGITIRDENDELKTLQGLVFQAQDPLPLHISFYPPTPTTSSHPSNQITPPVGILESEQAIFPSTPSAVATSSKVTLDTPFGGATVPEGSGNHVIDGILKCRQTKAFRLSHRTVEVPKLYGLRSKQEDLVNGVRVITSQSTTEAIRHIQSLLVPPKLKQPQALDSSGRTLRGIVLAAPVPDDHDPLVDAPPLLLLYGIKHTFPNDLKNKPRLLLFVTLYQPNPPKGTVLAARKRASLAMKPPPPAIPRTTVDDDDEERDPLPEPVKKRFKDRTGMGRGALLHHLPPPPPPPPPAPAPAAKRKVAASTGKGKEREGILVAAVESAAEVGGAGKRRRVELDGEVGVQRVEESRVVEVVQEKLELSIEQMNRNTLRSEVSLALLARGVPSDHRDLKTLGQWITRGAGFSLRETLTVQLLNAEDMSEAIGSHLESYLPKEFKTTKPPRVKTVEACSQTEQRGVTEMSTQTVEVEVAVELEVVMGEPAVEEDASPMEEDEAPVAVEVEVVEEQPSTVGLEVEGTTIVAVELQEEPIEEPSVEQEEEKDATSISISELPTPITPSDVPEVETTAPLPFTQPSPRRTRARPSSTVSPLRSAPATASTQVEPVPSPSAVLAPRQDSELTPNPSETEEEAIEEESETPTKTRSGRARVSNRGRKVVLSSPLKQSQVAKEPEEEVLVEEVGVDVEPEVVASMEVKQVVEEEIVEPEEVIVSVVEEQQVEPSPVESTTIELAPPPPPLPAPRRTSSRRASAVGLPTPIETTLPLPALPSPIVEQPPTILSSPPAAASAPSEPVLPPPSSLPSPSSSQTPTKLPFRRTRSNRSALSSNHDASSPVTPQASTSLFAVEVEVVTPTASTSTSNKRTRGGSKKLQTGQPEQEKEKEEEEEVNQTPTRATRSRRGSVMPSESVVVEEAKVMKSKGKGKKVVKKGKTAEVEVEVEVEAEVAEQQEEEKQMEGVVEESAVAVVEPVALEDELEEGEIREDDVLEAIVVEQEEAPVVVEQEEMQVEVEPVVPVPQPPPSPARLALSESPTTLRTNLEPTPATIVPSSPHLSHGLNKENESSVKVASDSPSTLPPSLPKVADLPPSPPTSAKPLPPPPTTQEPSVATVSEAAPPPFVSLSISSSSSSLPPRPTPTSTSKSDFNTRLSSAGLPSKPAPQPIQVHRTIVASPLPEPVVALEEVSKLVAVSLADAGEKKKKKKRSLPPLPSEYEDVDRKWKAGVIPSVKPSSSKPVVEEDKEKVVVAAPIQAPAPIVTAAARGASLVKEVSPPTVVSPITSAAASARPTAPPPAPKPVVALASLLAAYSSDDEDEEEEEEVESTPSTISPPSPVLASEEKKESESLVAVAAPTPKLVVDDFFEADEDLKAGSVERDPTMYYTDEDSDMRMEDGVGGVRIVKKGWF